MRRLAVLLALVLGACAGDFGGTVPSNRLVERDIDAVRRADAQDVRDLRALQPGLPAPTRGGDSMAPLTTR
jgi:hypothetical protein